MTPLASVPRIGRGEGLLLSRIEYARFCEVVDGLSDSEWLLEVPDCPGWRVRDVVAHVLGGLEGVRLPRELVRQVRAARRLDRDSLFDALNEVQVAEHASWPVERLAATLRESVEPALRMRRRTPLLLRRGVRPRLLPSGPRTSYGWVLDVLYTRDTFVHRLDVCRAVGADPVVDDVEGRVIADAAREWAAAHGKPVVLRLTGPAGGEYAAGEDGEVIECDAVEFARRLSGRGPQEGLLRRSVLF